MLGFKKKTLQEEYEAMERANLRVAQRENKTGFIKNSIESYKEKNKPIQQKITNRIKQDREYNKEKTKTWNELSSGAKHGLSGGMLYGRMTKRR